MDYTKEDLKVFKHRDIKPEQIDRIEMSRMIEHFFLFFIFQIDLSRFDDHQA